MSRVDKNIVPNSQTKDRMLSCCVGLHIIGLKCMILHSTDDRAPIICVSSTVCSKSIPKNEHQHAVIIIAYDPTELALLHAMYEQAHHTNRPKMRNLLPNSHAGMKGMGHCAVNIQGWGYRK